MAAPQAFLCLPKHPTRMLPLNAVALEGGQQPAGCWAGLWGPHTAQTHRPWQPCSPAGLRDASYSVCASVCVEMERHWPAERAEATINCGL